MAWSISKYVALGAVVTACGPGTIALPPRSPTVPQRVLFVDASRADEGWGMPGSAARGVRVHLHDTLAAYGFRLSDRYTPNAVTLTLLSVSRNTVSAELRGETAAVVLEADAGDCTSAAWGLYADGNHRCLARALIAELFAAPQFAMAFAAPPRFVAGPPGSIDP